MRMHFGGTVDLTHKKSRFDMWRKSHIKVVEVQQEKKHIRDVTGTMVQ